MVEGIVSLSVSQSFIYEESEDSVSSLIQDAINSIKEKLPESSIDFNSVEFEFKKIE